MFNNVKGFGKVNLGHIMSVLTLAAFIEKKPHFGILASLSGFGVSLLSLLHVATIVLGFGGAVFGLLAGYYTYRIKRHHWEREQNK